MIGEAETEMRSTNLNFQIRFKPKPEAHAFYAKTYEGWWHPNWGSIPTLKVDADGWSEMHLHEFMHTFGPNLYMGSNVVIETNVEIQVRK